MGEVRNDENDYCMCRHKVERTQDLKSRTKTTTCMIILISCFQRYRCYERVETIATS